MFDENIFFNKNRPPDFGGLQFEIAIAPVSQQANSSVKAELIKQVRSTIEPLEYILSGDVQIEIEWRLHEELRYETDKAPDVDNIIKPLLDALCGPEGLLIDDCQVQSVACYWIDWTRDDQRIAFRIKYLPGSWYPKKNLFFAQYPKGLCFPVNGNWPNDLIISSTSDVGRMLALREKKIKKSGDYYLSGSPC